MRIAMRCVEEGSELEVPRWDLAITGVGVDDRGDAGCEFVKSRSGTSSCLIYDVENLRLTADSTSLECEDLPEWLSKKGLRSLLLETTTLGLPELSLCCRAAKQLGLERLSALYVEPKDYFAPCRRYAIHRRDFELSDEIIGYAAIPGSAFLLDEQRQQQVVFFLGYEGHRLDRAFEQLPLVPERCSVVFGVPGFQPGWEMDSFANNVHVVRERKVDGGVGFCGADNPAAAFSLLDQRYRAKQAGERLFVAPIGTKPHGIGAALFAAVHEDVGLLYDHPLRSKKRSSQVGHWHLFDVAFDVHS